MSKVKLIEYIVKMLTSADLKAVQDVYHFTLHRI